MKRRTARESAFIVIFESFFLDIPLDDLIDYVCQNQNIKLNSYSESLILNILKKRKELDEKIKKFLKKWDIERISNILIAILEISFYEILYVDDVDFPVSINEAVELAKKYFGDDGPSFVNGVLGSFVKTI